MSKSKIWKVIKWAVAVIGIYYFLTLLYFGYSQVDERKGVYTFYWSGIRALFNNSEFGIRTTKSFDTKLDGVDGPYIIDSISYTIDKNSKLDKSLISVQDSISVTTGDESLPIFNLKLRKNYTAPLQVYASPNKLIAISDIEGNFSGFYSFLFHNQVIDKNGNWIFGDGHLVLNGDFVDRGTSVTQVLWLVYKLEQQAESAGGTVHYILGNHEIMMLQGNVSYANFKYMEAAKQISGVKYWDQAMRSLYSEETVLGKWLRSKNIAERIGHTLFVHAGLNIRHVQEKLGIPALNQIAKENYGKPYNTNYKNTAEELVLSSTRSPYWDRGLAMDAKNKALYLANNIQVKETSQYELEKILKYYQASRIVIGHSVVQDVQADYNGKVIKIDLKHGTSLRSGKTKGILIKDEHVFAIDDAGNTRILN